ncbi:MAG: inorganic phosphate transporter [Candidatus Muiribacteriota bacterium]
MWRILSGFFMGWGLGANDAANLFGPGVSAKIIKYRTATILIAIFALSGAVIEGTKCMESLGKLGDITGQNEAFIVLLSTSICVLIMSYFGIPISTGQAVVGSILGTEVFKTIAGFESTGANFSQLGKFFSAWVGTPIGACILAFIFFFVVDKFIEKYIENLILLDRFITISLLIAGCYGAYGLGANNVANATAVYVSTGMLTALQAAFIGGVAIAVGALTYSKKVMLTVGEKIAVIGPLGALIATVSHSIIIHIYTQVGIPVSSSQAIVGAVIGIGLVKGLKGVRLSKIFQIMAGWILTPLSAGSFAFIIFYVLNIIGFSVI